MSRSLARLASLVIGLVFASGALAQDPAALVETIRDAPTSPTAGDAALALASSQDKAKALEAIQAAWTKSPPSGITAARLAGAAVALGADYLDGAVVALLEQSPDQEKLALLAPLMQAQVARGPIIDAVAAARADPNPAVAEAATLAHGRLTGLGQSGSLIFFLGLLLLAGGAAFWHFSAGIDEAGITSDTLVEFVKEWTNKPRERDAILARIQADVEDAPTRFLELFSAEVRLTRDQVISILDLLSHFDVDAVHEKLYEFATNQDDEVRKVAILSMHRLGDDAWTGVLAEFVRSEDDVARYAGATALARRGSVDQLPLLREEIEKTRLGSVRDGMLEAIEKLEAMG